MIVGAWNIKDLSHPTKRDAIKRFVLKNKVDIMAILESRLRNNDSLYSFISQWHVNSIVGCANNFRIVLLR